eukprot:scaffold19555_cov112-Isochrysis_galbana.AAC.3
MREPQTLDNGIAAARPCMCAIARAGNPSVGSSVVDMYSARTTSPGGAVHAPASVTSRSTDSFSGASLVRVSAAKAPPGAPNPSAAFKDRDSRSRARAGVKRRMATFSTSASKSRIAF